MPTLKRTEASLSYVQGFSLFFEDFIYLFLDKSTIQGLCTMFLVSSSINVCIFHSIWLDTFWTGLIYNIDGIWMDMDMTHWKQKSNDGFKCVVKKGNNI